MLVPLRYITQPPMLSRKASSPSDDTTAGPGDREFFESGTELGDRRRPAGGRAADPPHDAIVEAPAEWFGSPRQIVLQPHEGDRVGSTASAAASDEGNTKLRRGLSPFLLYKNSLFAAARRSAGRPLTPEERSAVAQEARQSWDHMEDKSAHIALYEEWQRTPKASAQKQEEHQFRPHWGGGCLACPVSAKELCEEFRAHGWPTDAEVHREKSEYVPRSDGVDWAASKHYDFAGCRRAAVNVCKAEAQGNTAFGLVHRGLCNFVEHMPRDLAEGGTTLFLVEGATMASPTAVKRYVCLLAGTCWSPVVFDVVEHHFIDTTQGTAMQLNLPCTVCVSSRPSAVSDRFMSASVTTSAELSNNIAKACHSATLYEAGYTILLEGGTLKYARITSLKLVGKLLEPGLRKPLLHQEMADKRKAARPNASASLRQGDPLSAPPAGSRKVANRRGAARSGGRGTGGRKVGGRQQDVLDEVVEELPGLVAPVPGMFDASDAIGGADGMLPPTAGQVLGAAAPPSEDADVLGEAAVPFGAQYDEFDIEAELEEMLTSDTEELRATFGPTPEGKPQSDAATEAATSTVEGPLPDTMADIVAAALAGASATGLGEEAPTSTSDGAPGVGDEGSASNGADEEDFAAPVPADHASRCEGPSKMGYVTLDGKAVMRIQRGNPKNSLSVRCYRHTGCSFLLPLRFAPPDRELIAWCFEVPEAEPGASSATSKDLGKRHVDLSRRWRENGQASGSGAASSRAAATR